MFCNPVGAYSAKCVYASVTFAEAHNDERDDNRDDRYRRSYPQHLEHSISRHGQDDDVTDFRVRAASQNLFLTTRRADYLTTPRGPLPGDRHAQYGGGPVLDGGPPSA
jgi:hypothetical protein